MRFAIIMAIATATTVGFINASEMESNEFGRFLAETASTSVTFSSTLPCGQCIRGGFYYCVQGISATKCCQDAACVAADTSYTCSNTYAS